MTFVWDPPRDLFQIPYFDIPVTIYGFLFASGFLIAYFFVRASIKRYLLEKGLTKETASLESQNLIDSLVWMCVVGCIVGARLGHVLFYDWDYTLAHPSSVFMVQQGGLASHGGTLGTILGIYFFYRKNRSKLFGLRFIQLMDWIVVPAAIVSTFIRIGNFFNQEILGAPTSMPWGVTFLHPADGITGMPRHPVQLYEALAYLFTFVVLKVWSRKNPPPGAITGCFFMLIFGFRFLIEFLKSSQGGAFDEWMLQTGQILSIPFISIGFLIYWKAYKTPAN